MATIYKPKRQSPSRYDHKRKERMKIYATARWKRLRTLKLADDPLCEVCLHAGVVTAAEEVHHKVSIGNVSDPLLLKRIAYDYDNLQSICKACHQKVHHGKIKKS